MGNLISKEAATGLLLLKFYKKALVVHVRKHHRTKPFDSPRKEGGKKTKKKDIENRLKNFIF